MQKLYRFLGIAIMLIFLQACSCYGITSESALYYLFYGIYHSADDLGSAMDCSKLRVASVGEYSSSYFVIWYGEGASYEVTLYYQGNPIQVFNRSASPTDVSFRIDWASLAGDEDAELEILAVGVIGDTCTTQTTISRPESTEEAIPPVITMLCADLRLTAPLGGMANGFETFYWDALDGAESYHLNVYGNGVLLAGWDAVNGMTNLSIDVSTATIGGETPLEVELIALDSAGNSCSQIYTIAREAAAPQVIPPTATPTCEEDSSAPYC